MHVLHVVGARPNFMKSAPVLAALAACGVRQTLVHTGQHYDRPMSDVFFEELGIPEPDLNLEVGSGSHTVQTAAIMSRFEPVVLERKPDLTVVYGDVNSTVAAALVCAKLQTPLAHVEAGLRSFDRSMPEEINRMVTDRLADLLFTPSKDGDENLRAEGIEDSKIHCVGNVMIDTLVRLYDRAEAAFAPLERRFRLMRYGLVTLHRPSNVDDPATLCRILETLVEVSRELPLLFPIHPRTGKQMQLPKETHGLQFCDPLSYLEFLSLQKHALLVITDSGGIQEETTFLGVPCLTLRENTERPVTVTSGSNVLIGRDLNRLRTEVRNILEGRTKRSGIPPLWDGHAAERIAKVVVNGQ
jgi:UDP-N-acetylglucosamine 2-epimerase (non-hydrolysing)